MVSLIPSTASAACECLVVYSRVNDARTFALPTALDAVERSRAAAILNGLSAEGLVTLASVNRLPPAIAGFPDLLRHLQATLGALTIDAVAAAAPFPHSPLPPPTAIMPVWEFEPVDTGSEELVASGRLLGSELLLRALRVQDDDVPEPLPAVADRFYRLRQAAGVQGDLSTCWIPGRGGPYVLFASPARA